MPAFDPHKTPTVTVVMYHYVRDLARTRYPEIKGLDAKKFRSQLMHIRRRYEVITAADLMEAFRNRNGTWPLPPNALLLTFDDGLMDHYDTVFPLLDECKLQGCFFVPLHSLWEHKVLDVHKVHFILASAGDNKSRIATAILDGVHRYREQWSLESDDFYLNKYAVAWRYDTAEVIFIKRMLQLGLPAPVRHQLTHELFSAMVTTDEGAFSAELYMNEDQLRCLGRNGMYVGPHGYSHSWMAELDPKQQTQEVDQMVSFLKQIGSDAGRWMFSYPFGNSNDSLRRLSRERGCAVGLTTEINQVTPQTDPMLCPRIDANELPTSGD